MKNNRENTLNVWAEREANALVVKVFEACAKVSRAKGEDANSLLLKVFLTRFVGALVFKTLANAAQEGGENHTQHRFALVKLDIQEAVGLAFQQATRVYSGRQLDYYCDIKLLPEVINKRPC